MTQGHRRTRSPYRCIGILGRLFGHRFEDFSNYFTHCSRCGMPKGGWRR